MRALPLLSTIALALAGCGPPKTITVDNAYVRLPAVARAPAAAYFTLHGGAEDATLIDVGTTVAIRTEMHESMRAGAMTGVKPLRQVALPADTALAFAPRGRHVMVFDVNPGIKRGSILPLLFTFSNGQRVSAKAIAIAPGDPAPAH